MLQPGGLHHINAARAHSADALPALARGTNASAALRRNGLDMRKPVGQHRAPRAPRPADVGVQDLILQP